MIRSYLYYTRLLTLWCASVSIDWMNEYKTVLEQVIKYDLFKGDNKVTCLYQRYKDKFSVVVDMVPVANEGGTNIEQCGAQSDNKLQWEP